MRLKYVAVAVPAAALVLLPLTGNAYFERLATLGAIFGVLALGLNLTAGHLGLFDFGYVVYFGIGGYATALLTLRAGWPFAPALVASVVAAAAISLVIGVVVLRLRGPYFVIATFSFLTVTYYVAVNWTSFTNGGLGLIGVPVASITLPLIGEVSALSGGAALELALAALGLVAVIVWRLGATSLGRSWHAIRDNEDLALAVGIDPRKYGLIALIISAAFGGFAGSIYAQYIGIVTPEIFGFGHMVDVLLIIVIGGTGGFFGPMAAAFLVIAVPEMLRAAESYRLPIYGLILVVTILFAPRGLATIDLKRLRRRATGAASEASAGVD